MIIRVKKIAAMSVLQTTHQNSCLYFDQNPMFNVKMPDYSLAAFVFVCTDKYITICCRCLHLKENSCN